MAQELFATKPEDLTPQNCEAIAVKLGCDVMKYRATFASAEDWPRFRGPEGGGVSGSTGLPVELGPGKNLLWRVDVPMGRSSPIVVKDRLYLIWLESARSSPWRSTRRPVRPAGARSRAQRGIYAGSSTAAPTAASDGENLYVFFPDLGLVSFDAAGAERWRLALGPFDSFYGISSPVVHERTLAVCDQPSGAFVLAVDRATGRVRWRTERKQATTEATRRPPSCRRPGIAARGERHLSRRRLRPRAARTCGGSAGRDLPDRLAVLFGDMVIAVSEGGDTPAYPAFDAMLKELDTNKDEWLSPEVEPPRVQGPLRLAGRGQGCAHHAGGVGGSAEESVSEHGATGSRISDAATAPRRTSSGATESVLAAGRLVYQGVLYLVKDGGIVTTLDPRTGEVLKAGRTVDGIDEYFASPVAADGKVFLLSHSGKLTVLKAGAQWEVLGSSDLDEASQATPAIADGRIYVRTQKALYAFGAPRP
jgi:outer membrane protein assembly factor BamB